MCGGVVGQDKERATHGADARRLPCHRLRVVVPVLQTDIVVVIRQVDIAIEDQGMNVGVVIVAAVGIHEHARVEEADKQSEKEKAEDYLMDVLLHYPQHGGVATKNGGFDDRRLRTNKEARN
jgi:hypothetical protein